MRTSISHANTWNSNFTACLAAYAEKAKRSGLCSRCLWRPQAKALEKKPAKKAALEKVQGEAFTTCLVNPFVEAVKADRRRSLRALSQAWLAYLAHVQVGCFLSYSALVEMQGF
jgi:hypothetical protein